MRVSGHHKGHPLTKVCIIAILLLWCPLIGKAQTTSAETELHRQVERQLDSCFKANSSSPLHSWIETVQGNTKEEQDFWRAYGLFHLAVYFDYRASTDESEAERLCNLAISHLEIHPMSADHLALQGYIAGYALKYCAGPIRWNRARKVQNIVEKAARLDPQSPMTLFVHGNMLVRGPSFWVDRDSGADMLRKAIEFYAAGAFAKNYNWGQEECYESLLWYLMDKEAHEEARVVYAEALRYFPKSRNIRQLSPP